MMRGCHRRLPAQAGFSLIELAVVLVIVGLLVGGGIAALEATTQQSRRNEQQVQLDRIREALYGFALAEGRLPCPDTDYPPDGVENPVPPPDPTAGEACDAAVGTLPWRALGLGRRNPWGEPLRFHVDPEFADLAVDDDGNLDPDGSSFKLDGGGNLVVRGADGQVIVDNAPALVASFAAQGQQAWTDTAFICPGDGPPASGFSDDETENCDGDLEYIAAGYRQPEAPEGRFDDLVIWLSAPVLKARMVDVGRLP